MKKIIAFIFVVFATLFICPINANAYDCHADCALSDSEAVEYVAKNYGMSVGEFKQKIATAKQEKQPQETLSPQPISIDWWGTLKVSVLVASFIFILTLIGAGISKSFHS